jgi:hypothetical protein
MFRMEARRNSYDACRVPALRSFIHLASITGDRKGIIDLIFGPCRCGHSEEKHVYPGSTLYGDCHECLCELYNPARADGLKGVPIHPLFSFTEDQFRFVACSQCGRFRVLPEGLCEACWWDNDNQGPIESTRPDYCYHSLTRKHVIPWVTSFLRANYCICCLKTIKNGTTERHENVMRSWKAKRPKRL